MVITISCSLQDCNDFLNLNFKAVMDFTLFEKFGKNKSKN